MPAAKDPFEDPVKQKKYLKLAFFGKGGTGKTRAALSFPKPCVIDTEKGTQPYIGKYRFRAKVATRWKQLEPFLVWLRANPGVYETLVIDSGTVFYSDLIQEIVDYIKNKRGNEIMTNGDWGVEKRRWAAFLNQLVELPMHVILTFREKDEYEDSTNRAGEEIRKKTGNFEFQADKQTEYIFDLTYRFYTEENKKAKTSKFLMTCTKSRYEEWSPKYGIWDFTGKKVFDAFFAPNVASMLDAPDAPAVEVTETITVAPDAPPADPVESAAEPAAVEDPQPVVQNTPEENCRQLNDYFGVVQPSPDQPEATLEDIKVLMTKAGKMTWPDPALKCQKQDCKAKNHVHEKFLGVHGKELLRACYGVESSKELRKPQVDFLHVEFGKVLAGKAFLDRDPQGVIYIATPQQHAANEEVRAAGGGYAGK